jgi:hypothetical protein
VNDGASEGKAGRRLVLVADELVLVGRQHVVEVDPPSLASAVPCPTHETVGLVLLVGLALAVGASLDASAADARWRQVAGERRRRDEERRRLEVLRHDVHEAGRRLREQQAALRDLGRRHPLCSRCPLRSPPMPSD